MRRGILDVFRQVQEELRRPGVAGWWVEVLEELDDDRRTALETAAADRTITHRTISVVLERWGYQVTPARVAHWRRTYVYR